MDLLQLLPQEHLPLALAQFFLNLGLDIFLSIDPGQLTLDCNEGCPHPSFVGENLQELLFVRSGEFEIEGHQVCEGPGIVHTLDQLIQRFHGHTSPCSQLGSPFPKLAIHSLEGRVFEGGGWLTFKGQKVGLEHGLAILEVGQSLSPTLPLNEKLHSSPDPVGLDDPHHGPDIVQDLGMGIVHIFHLGHCEESPVALQRFLHRLHRPGTTGRDWNRNSGIDHRIPKRKHRK